MKLLGKLWQTWKRIGQVIGDFIGRIVLTIFYFTIFMPFGLGVRLFSDPLSIKRRGQLQWLIPSKLSETIDDARRLF